MEFLKNVVSSAIGSIIGLVVAGTILIFIFVGALVGGFASAFSETEGIDVNVNEDGANVLVFEMNDRIVERGGGESINFDITGLNSESTMGLDQILEGLERASADEDIEGIYMNLSGVAAMPSTLEDIREGLENFQDSGKWVVAWAEGMSQGGYYMNSVADEIYLHPNGSLSIAGLRSQLMFYPGLFEKLGIDVTVLRGPNNKFKSAVEPYLRKDLSEANKEQLGALLGDFWDNMNESIAESRGLEPNALDDIANDISIRVAEDAVEHGLVDKLLYEDEIEALLKEKVGGEDELQTLSFKEYTVGEELFGFDLSDPDAIVEMFENAEGGSDEEESKDLGGDVAVIYAVGGIESGEGDAETIGSVTIANAIKEARLAPDVKAVVLRVNSPGGSALASDVIWRETVLLKEAGKHFVVSMGDLAASGGYYISCAADKIFANSTTITGSIGVFGLIPNLGGAYQKHLGITFDDISTHDHAGAPDGVFAMNQFEMDAYNEIIIDIYEDFTSKVSEGRGMTREQVEEVARGRVWTGEDALEIGLVDELGNLDDAITHAEQLIGGDEHEKVYLPEMKDPLEALIEDFAGVQTKLNALEILGADPTMIKDVLAVKRVIESGEVAQARLPFNIQIK